MGSTPARQTVAVTTNMGAGSLVRERWSQLMAFYNKYLDGEEATPTSEATSRWIRKGS